MNPLAAIAAALGLGLPSAGLSGMPDLSAQQPVFKPLPQFRGATAPRQKRSIPKHRGHLAKYARNYAVRYTHTGSRKVASEALLHESRVAFRSGDKVRGEKLLNASATFPW
jgi:hypothetical protein